MFRIKGRNLHIQRKGWFNQGDISDFLLSMVSGLKEGSYEGVI